MLVESSNKGYRNAIFPVKRAYLAEKERGDKVTCGVKDGNLESIETTPQIAFIPPCTNVFAKAYTPVSYNMLAWTKTDAEYYLNALKEKLKYYLDE